MRVCDRPLLKSYTTPPENLKNEVAQALLLALAFAPRTQPRGASCPGPLMRGGFATDTAQFDDRPLVGFAFIEKIRDLLS